MDKTMTRRIIGAIVLVLVAALILAALLRGKSKQQEIVDVSSPAEPILQFPDDTQSDGTMDANQTVPGQNLTGGSDTDKVGFDVTQSGSTTPPDTTENTANTDNTTTTSTTDTGSGSTTMRDKPSNTVVEDEKPEETKRSETTQRTMSERDRLDLDGKDDRISPSRSDEKLVNEPKLPTVTEKPKDPPKEEKPTEPAAVIPTDGDFPTEGFSIQLVATGDQVKAQQMMQQMIGEGYPAYVQPVTVNDRAVYRVRIGSYEEKAEAEEVQARMKRRYLKNLNVQNSAIYSNTKD
jgi:cell division septation protein DedD